MFKGNNKNDVLEDTLLRSSILYRQVHKDTDSKSLMSIAILGIITYQACGIDRIVELLNSRFQLQITNEDVKKYVSKLLREKLIREDDNHTYHSIEERDGDGSFYEKLNAEKGVLLSGINRRMKQSLSTSLSDQMKSKVNNNALEALSAYYHHFGYSFVDLKMGGSKDQIKDAVAVAKHGLDGKTGESLVLCLCDLISNPTEEESEILEMWARAFVTLEILNFDPMFRNFKKTKLHDKKFVVDTDVALHCLTTHAKHSKDYGIVIKRLVEDVGCKLIIPSKVIEEIETHLKLARYHYWNVQSNIDSIPLDLLENRNVFLEDYIKIIRFDTSRSKMPFRIYLNNIYHPQHQVLLIKKIKKVFGESVRFLGDEELVELKADDEKNLAKVIKERTLHQEKGGKRRDEHNEKIADLDARLYLTIKRWNDSEAVDGNPLSHKSHLLTQSRKIKSAVDRLFPGDTSASCICSPVALLSVLYEMGRVGSDYRIKYINLFDNPFLSYTANRTWEKIKPAIDQKIHMKYSDIERLRLDADIDLDKLLTLKDSDEIEDYAKTLSDKGYIFAKELMDAKNEARETKRENEKLKEENSYLRSQRRTERYKKRIELKGGKRRGRR